MFERFFSSASGGFTLLLPSGGCPVRRYLENVLAEKFDNALIVEGKTEGAGPRTAVARVEWDCVPTAVPPC